jgi:hypothetical protein
LRRYIAAAPFRGTSIITWLWPNIAPYILNGSSNLSSNSRLSFNRSWFTLDNIGYYRLVFNRLQTAQAD